MEELRRIILGAEADRIADLQGRLDLIAALQEKGQIEAMSRARIYAELLGNAIVVSVGDTYTVVIDRS